MYLVSVCLWPIVTISISVNLTLLNQLFKPINVLINWMFALMVLAWFELIYGISGCMQGVELLVKEWRPSNLCTVAYHFQLHEWMHKWWKLLPFQSSCRTLPTESAIAHLGNCLHIHLGKVCMTAGSCDRSHDPHQILKAFLAQLFTSGVCEYNWGV